MSLNSSIFRKINEKFYKENSNDSFNYLKKNKGDFEIYHLGYDEQKKKWPMDPLNIIYSEIKKNQKKMVIADLGCGTARLSKMHKKNKYYNFDFISSDSSIIECNIKKTKLQEKSIDISVFCFSLMGKDYYKFLLEAKKITRTNVVIFIAELESGINLKFFNRGGVENTHLPLLEILELCTL